MISIEEAEKIYSEGLPRKVIDLVKSETPFMPGVISKGAMLYVFNAFTYQRGLGVFVQQDDGIWKPKKPFKYFDFELKDKFRDQMEAKENNKIVQIPTAVKIIEQLFFALPSGYENIFSRNPKAAQLLYEKLVLLRAIKNHPKVFNIAEKSVMEEIVNLFRKYAPKNNLYAYGRCLVAQGADKYGDQWKLDFK